MQLNKIPQVHEVTITCPTSVVQDICVDDTNTLVFDNIPFIFFKKTINYFNNTTTFSLYFSDMPSQDNFLKVLPKYDYSFSLKGLVYFEFFIDALEDIING